LSLIKRRFTTAIAKAGATVARRQNGERALWQRRFWEHTIRDETDYERHVDYIHFNPVKHSLVTRVRDWPYSSFHRFVRRGILPQDWAGDSSQHRASFGEHKR
jgi:putative transposase